MTLDRVSDSGSQTQKSLMGPSADHSSREQLQREPKESLGYNFFGAFSLSQSALALAASQRVINRCSHSPSSSNAAKLGLSTLLDRSADVTEEMEGARGARRERW